MKAESANDVNVNNYQYTSASFRYFQEHKVVQ